MVVQLSPVLAHFYREALVLGVDVGIEGIGVWLRKGPRPLFAHTFLVSLPEAAPLKNRRGKRAWRRARTSRRHRDQLLKAWIVKHGLLPQVELDEMWTKPKAFDRPFEHRYRAIHQGVPSPHCLVVCLRQIVRHRGFDYHLTEESVYPWGEELDAKEILQWAEHAPCSPAYQAKLLTQIWSDASWAKDAKGEPTEKYQSVETALAAAVTAYETKPIERMLEQHMSEKQHPNLRHRARTHNFPRELVKEHLYAICERHRHFFREDDFEPAMTELLGTRTESGAWHSKTDGQMPIIDYHRRTQQEAEALWLRRTKDCPYADALRARGALAGAPHKCALRRDPHVRRFNLAMFLAERRVQLNDQRGTRVLLPAEVVTWLFEELEADLAATAVMFTSPSAQPAASGPKRPDKPGFKRLIARFKSLPLAKPSESPLNTLFFDQLGDLVRPETGSLRSRASLGAESARVFFDAMTAGGTDYDPGAMQSRLSQFDYYALRKDQDRNPGVFPQVEFLLGHRNQYGDNGEPRDLHGRKDGKVQHHGVLRKLFAGQLRLDDGTVVDLSDELDGATEPEFVVVETIGDMPRNKDEKTEILRENKQKRARKAEVLGKYGLKMSDLSESQIRRVMLFDQQANREGEAFSPYTGESLGKNPLAQALEVEHVFPRQRGGISIMDNLVITTREENAKKGVRTPFEWLGAKVGEFTSGMNWNRAKRAHFLREETACPDWDNTTRMAQLARHLRGEVIHWLGIRRQFAHIADAGVRATEISKEISRRIGTPVGGQTAVCREEWLPARVFPQMYCERQTQSGRTIWVKDRSNLRHHLWDAATLAHIPPGVGLNSVECAGIFRTVIDVNGEPRMSVLPQLGPDLCAFERANAGRCLVSKPRQRKSKKSRYKQMILSRPDAEGNCWLREPLSDIVASLLKPGAKVDPLTELKQLFDRPGLLRPRIAERGRRKGQEIPPLLTEKDIEEWWLGLQSQHISRQAFADLLKELGVPAAQVPEGAIGKLFKDREKLSLTGAKSLIRFVRKDCGVPADQIPDSRIEDVLQARAAKAELRGRSIKPGVPGQPIRSLRIQQNSMAYSAGHFTKESAEAVGLKAVDNSSGVTILARRIYRRQVLKRVGKSEQPAIEYAHQLIPHPRHIASQERLLGKGACIAAVPEGMQLVCSLAVGDLLRVPFKREKKNKSDGLFARRGEAYPGGVFFYRISSLEIKNDRVALTLAEFDPPKLDKDRTPSPREAWLQKIHKFAVTRDEDLVWLWEFTRGVADAKPEAGAETSM